jgi:hypothetical protein
METFDNPAIPAWLEFGLLKAFRDKNVDHIKGYQKLLEDMLYGER